MQNKIIEQYIEEEKQRQNNTIELIASENYPSKDVLEAAGSVLTSKYSEGYPGKRYYGGCHVVDKIEQYAIDAAKKLFNAEHANVQPHSGSQANAAVYAAVLQHGDKILAMSLNAGGHLSHGNTLSFSGRDYVFQHYGVDQQTQRINYDEVQKIALEFKPKMIVAGASAYSRIIDFQRFRAIADSVGAYLMVDMAHIAGLVATGFHPSPVPFADFVTTTTHKTLRGPRGGLILCKQKYAKEIDRSVFPGQQGGPLQHIIAAKAICFDEAMKPEFVAYMSKVVKSSKVFAAEMCKLGYKVVSGGTDNHLFLVDVSSFGVNGKEVEILLDSINISCNKNTIPFDTLPPLKASGIRLGTAAMVSRGFNSSDFITIAKIIDSAIENRNNEKALEELRLKVARLLKKRYIKEVDAL